MEDWASGYVTANGIRIHYTRTGGGKRPLVCSHGFGSNGLTWGRAAQALKLRYDVVMPDARGHGLTDAPASGYTVQARAADLVGFIRALGLEKPALLGHSMGADTTAYVAAYDPDQASAAMLEDPPWRDGTDAERATTMAEWKAEAIRRQGMTFEQILAEGREKNPGWDDMDYEAWAVSRQQLSLNVFNEPAAPRPPWREIAAGLSIPTLLLTAEPSRGSIVTQAVAVEAKTLSPQVTVVEIKGAGHSIRREQFDVFLDAVKAFLDQCAPASKR